MVDVTRATFRVVPGQLAAQARLPDIERLLNELRHLLATHAAEVNDPDGAHAAVAAASDEVRTGRPEPGRMRILLNAVADAAPALGSVAQAVRDLIRLTNGTR
ncbi:hypothetical protein [Virgisporangium aurantiacum]|uniref:Uncharacterized protein n=1 Tax=Virgisporangium aurantiacum TaxID=175570 RepID=A0A8J3Z7H5_9ACTN|nr:hypothetical protein [Virgisporangium aurantiacum]GIJ58894.1 hypothetical protein Vau01_064100 [Virgisporangium aurantiacum]